MLRKVLEIGGVVAAAVLVAFGIASVILSVQGQNTVNSSLRQQQIYGTPDMSPKGIASELTAAKTQQTALFKKLNAAGIKFNGATPVASSITAPGCSVANQFVDNGSKARCFAGYMWVHVMGATSGLTYSQMARFQAKANAPFKMTDGLGGTNDPTFAATDPKTLQPIDNGRRDLWVTYTALTTALNASYMASQISMFGIVVGVALLLSGFGFAILAIGGALRAPETALASLLGRWAHKGSQAPALPAA